MGLHPERHFNLERSYRRNSSSSSIMRKTNMLVVFTFLLLSLPVFVTNVKAVSYQAGKINITDKSQNNHGCESVSFETQFQGSQDVKVVLTLSHDRQFTKIHDPAALWVKSLSTFGFEACTREAGSGSDGASEITWLAFQGSYQGEEAGIEQFDEFSTRTKCKKISLSIQTKESFDHKQERTPLYGNTE